MIKFPGFRRRLIINIKNLFDVDLQISTWVNSKYVHSFWDYLDIAVEVIFDEANLDKHPEKQIGYLLRNQSEVEALKPVIKALDAVLDKIGIEQPDSAYLNSPLWQDVVMAAKHAYVVLMQDEDLDALLEAENQRS